MESSSLVHELPVSLQRILTSEDEICSVSHIVQPLTYCTFFCRYEDFRSFERGVEKTSADAGTPLLIRTAF